MDDEHNKTKRKRIGSVLKSVGAAALVTAAAVVAAGIILSSRDEDDEATDDNGERLCQDGWLTSASGRGTCSHHGGLAD